MKKLKLKLDNLKVETFETQPQTNKLKGTVKGFDSLDNTNCLTCEPTCFLPTCETCGYTCRTSCFETDVCICPTRP